ncbi:hypothetical protein LTR93_011765 [Exophiala xenobiotica]|nr:hypothetical protein LTR93_011765 [Exophiala xenobiotica]
MVLPSVLLNAAASANEDTQDEDVEHDTLASDKLEEGEDEEGESEADILPLLVQQSHRREQNGTKQHSATLTAGHSDLRQTSSLKTVKATRETKVSDRWRTSTSFRPLFGRSISFGELSNGLLSPFQPPTTGPGPHRPWPAADKEKAIKMLQARGVVFESDSEEDMSDDSASEVPSRRIDALWQPKQSMDLLELERWSAQTYERRSHESSQLQPSKKQMLGNLLRYQCRDRRRKFGNPHQKISRHVPDVQIRAWVQRNVQEEQLEAHEVVEEERMMTLRQFVGMPEMPVIVQAKNKNELAFMEGKRDREKTRYGSGTATLRARRKKEEDKFPFVY